MSCAITRSIVYLPDQGPPYPSILDFLATRFPKIAKKVWLERLACGKITTENGSQVDLSTPYLPNQRLFYYREVKEEAPIPFYEDIVFENDHLLVACKPAFLPTTPTGPYIHETLLNRLQKRTGTLDLSPIHRIDRETSGLVLFSKKVQSRGLYQRLFMNQEIQKTYLAVAKFDMKGGKKHWQVANRIVEGDPWFAMRIVPGAPNTKTSIDLLDTAGDTGLFRLQPSTGKKHQLRLHLASLGCPILNDRCYPVLQEKISADDYSRPLQLLSWQISFKDPISGENWCFTSARHLCTWPTPFP